MCYREAIEHPQLSITFSPPSEGTDGDGEKSDQRKKKKFECQPLPPFFLFFFPFLLRRAPPPRLLAMHRYPNKRASKNTPSFFLLLPAYYSVQPMGQFSLKFFLSYRTVTDCAPTTGRTRISYPYAKTLELPLLVRSSVFSFFFCVCLGGLIFGVFFAWFLEEGNFGLVNYLARRLFIRVPPVRAGLPWLAPQLTFSFFLYATCLSTLTL